MTCLENTFTIWQNELYGRLSTIYTHLEIWQALNDQFREYDEKEDSDWGLFFYYTRMLYLNCAVLDLCAITLERDKSSGSLLSLLQFAAKNPQLFSEKAVLASVNIKAGPPIESEHIRRYLLDQTGIVKLCAELENLGPQMSNVRKWRNKLIAHLDKKVIQGEIVVETKYPIRVQDLIDVLDAAANILDRLSLAYSVQSVDWRVATDVPRQVNYLVTSARFRRKSESACRYLARNR